MGTGNSFTGSYTWMYDNTTVKGVQHGNCYEGDSQYDICTVSWYEPAAEEGIALFVAKNANTHYETWFYVPSLAAFDPKHIHDKDDYHHNSHDSFIQKHEPANKAEIKAKANEFACYALWTKELEAKCLDKCELS